jgi:hypothetical protein
MPWPLWIVFGCLVLLAVTDAMRDGDNDPTYW